MKKITSVILTLVLCVSVFSSCAASPKGTAGASSAPSASPSSDAQKLSVRAGFLKGPTGIGASYLMDQSAKGAAALKYDFTVEVDPTNISSGIVAGTLDIAAVPTNMAAILFNKTKGNIKILAVNTLSVLYILEKGNTIKSVADLRGKTIYATGQASNPEYVLDYILRKNGLEPGKDVTVEFLDASELATKMASGSIDIAMLPVPNSTSVLVKNKDVRAALNLGDEWKKVSGGTELTQGCVVIRSNLKDADKIADAFLKDYKASVDYMSDKANLNDAAQLAAKYQMVASADIAKAALPDCGLTFISGAKDIKTSLSGYFDVLFKADPKSLGGSMPDDTFYFGNK